MKIKSVIRKIKSNKIVRESIAFVNAMGERSVAPSSASIAYYLFISIIPIFILLCSQLPLTGITKSELSSAVTNLLPPSIKVLVSSIITEAYYSRVGVFSVSIIILLWSSSRGVFALIRALDIVYRVHEKRRFWDMLAFSLLYTVCIIAMLSAWLVLSTKESTAEDLIRALIPSKFIFKRVILIFKNFYVLFSATMVFALLYKVAPFGKRKFIHQIPGAVFSVAAISLFSVYFAKYSSGANIYKSFYGSLTTITIFLIWMYSCINIILIGGVINSHYKDKISSLSDLILNKIRFKKFVREQKRIVRKNKKIKKQKNSNGAN